MKSCFRFLVLSVFALVYSGCSNEIEVLADYEESAAIYGLLDPNSNVQFIKINKVFVNPNSRATDVAKIADSLYFDTISPELVEVGTGRRIPLFKANIALKDSGTFANSPNYLYVTTEQIFQTQTYRLEMKLPNSGKLISAQTNIAMNPNVYQPVNPFSRIINVPPTGNLILQFETGMNSKIFDCFFNFSYVEQNKFDSTIKETKTISWKIMRSFRSSTNKDKDKEIVTQRTSGSSFYSLLLNELKPNPNIIRKFTYCSVILVSGNRELDTYIQSSTPSIGIVQKQTEYTNFDNAVGIFASRNTMYFDQVTISETMKTVLTQDLNYKSLGFVRN